jgi:1,4-alpha-glucan branching enzyme
MEHDQAMVVCNFSNQVYRSYRIGVPRGGRWEEILNSDASIYGGSGLGNMGGLVPSPIGWNRQPHSLVLLLPPFTVLIFKKSPR